MSIVPSRGADQFPVRLPEGMRESIKAAAKDNGRSMNSEIIARLEQSSMSLRDYFAAQALPAIVGSNRLLDDIARAIPIDAEINPRVARLAYALADAMLAERSRK